MNTKTHIKIPTILFTVITGLILFVGLNLGTLAHSEIVFQNHQITAEQLNNCAEKVNWQVTVKNPDFFSQYESILLSMLVGPAMNAKMQCPALKEIIVIGVSNGERKYAGRMDQMSGWMLKRADLSTVADIELAGDLQARLEEALQPLDKIDILAPYGIKRGMRIEQVAQHLKKLGLVKTLGGSTCNWKIQLEDAQLMIGIDVQSKIGKTRDQMQCKDDELVNFATISQREARPKPLGQLPSSEEFVRRWQDRFGEPLHASLCTKNIQTIPVKRVRCLFENVNKDVGQIVLNYSYGGLQPNALLSTSIVHVGDMPKPVAKPGSLLDQIQKAAPNK